jgi:hypothetical protein
MPGTKESGTAAAGANSSRSIPRFLTRLLPNPTEARAALLRVCNRTATGHLYGAPV